MPRGGGGSARGYKPGGVYLRPGSVASRALEVLRQETARAGHALTVTEWTRAYEHATGDAISLNDVVTKMRRRQLVTVVGGRTRSLQYCVTEHPVPPAPSLDVHELVYDIVADLCVAAGHATTVDAVRQRLIAQGVQRTPDQVGTTLDLLAQPNARLARPEHATTRIECVRVTGEYWGREMRFWRPLNTNFPPPAIVPSTSAAVRAAVAETTTMLGWVPTPREITAWLALHPGHPVSVALATGGISQRISQAARGMVGRDNSGLVDVSSPMVSGGGIPLRVALTDPDHLSVLTARYIDLCYRLRPADELASVDRLCQKADRLHLPALATFAHTRAQATIDAVIAEMTCEAQGAPVPWGDIHDRLTQGVGALEDAWAVRTTETRLAPVWLERSRAAATALPVLRAALPNARSGMQLSMIGHLGWRPGAVAMRWLTEVLESEGLHRRNPRMLFSAVRRVPNRDRDRGPLYDPEHEGWSHLDVGDVLLTLAGLTSRARLAVLLQTVVDILGYAVRDPGPIRWLLRELPAYERLYRHGAVLALAGLGSLAPLEDALRDGRDEDGLMVYMLSLAISPMSTEEQLRRADEAHRMVGHGLRDRAAELRRRLAQGAALGVAM